MRKLRHSARNKRAKRRIRNLVILAGILCAICAFGGTGNGGATDNVMQALVNNGYKVVMNDEEIALSELPKDYLCEVGSTNKTVKISANTTGVTWTSGVR